MSRIPFSRHQDFNERAIERIIKDFHFLTIYKGTSRFPINKTSTTVNVIPILL